MIALNEHQERTNIYLKHIGLDVDIIDGRCVVSPIMDNDGIKIKRCPKLNLDWANTGEGEMLLPDEENPTWSHFIFNRSDGAVELSFGTEESMKVEAEKMELKAGNVKLRSKIKKLEAEIEERIKILDELQINKNSLL